MPKYFKNPSQQRGIVTPNINTPLRRTAIAEDTTAQARSRETLKAIDRIGRAVQSIPADIDRIEKKDTDSVNKQAKYDVESGRDSSISDRPKAKEAFNRLKGEAIASKLPSYVQEYVNGKIGDYSNASDEDIQKYRTEATEAFYKEHEDKPYLEDLRISGNGKAAQLDGFLMNARDKVQRGQAKELLKQKALDTFDDFENPKDFQEVMNSYKEEARLAMTQGNLPTPSDQEIDQTIIEAIMVEAMQVSPDGRMNEKAIAFINSDQAKKSFGKLSGFGASLAGANKQIKKNREKAFDELKDRQKEGIYDTWLQGGWTSPAAMKSHIMKTKLDSSTKSSLIDKFSKKFDTEVGGSNAYKALIDSENPNRTIYENAKPEEQNYVLKRMTGIDPERDNMAHLATDNPKGVQKLVEFLKNEVNLPKSVKQSFDAPMYNGNMDMLMANVETYKAIEGLSSKAVSQIYPSHKASKILLASSLFRDDTMKDKDGMPDSVKIKEALDQYELATRKDANGDIPLEQFKAAYKNKEDGIQRKLEDFVKDSRDLGFYWDTNAAHRYGTAKIKNYFLRAKAAHLSDTKAAEKAREDFKSNHSNLAFENGIEVSMPKTWTRTVDVIGGIQAMAEDADLSKEIADRVGISEIDPDDLYVIPVNKANDSVRFMYNDRDINLEMTLDKFKSVMGHLEAKRIREKKDKIELIKPKRKTRSEIEKIQAAQHRLFFKHPLDLEI